MVKTMRFLYRRRIERLTRNREEQDTKERVSLNLILCLLYTSAIIYVKSDI